MGYPKVKKTFWVALFYRLNYKKIFFISISFVFFVIISIFAPKLIILKTICMKVLNERQAKILESLETKRYISVSELSDRLKVSVVTIRKDLF